MRREFGVDVDKYLKGFPEAPLSQEEEQRIGSLPPGDRERWKLVTYNARFAMSMALELFNKNTKLNDGAAVVSAVQEALAECRTTFEAGHNTRFITYARRKIGWRIKDEIIRQLCVARHPKLKESTKHLFETDLGWKNLTADTGQSLDSEDFDLLIQGSDNVVHNISDDSIEHQELCRDLVLEVDRLTRRGKLHPNFAKYACLHYGVGGSEPKSYRELGSNGEEKSATQIQQIVRRGFYWLQKSSLLRSHR